MEGGDLEHGSTSLLLTFRFLVSACFEESNWHSKGSFLYKTLFRVGCVSCLLFFFFLTAIYCISLRNKNRKNPILSSCYLCYTVCKVYNLMVSVFLISPTPFFSGEEQNLERLNGTPKFTWLSLKL